MKISIIIPLIVSSIIFIIKIIHIYTIKLKIIKIGEQFDDTKNILRYYYNQKVEQKLQEIEKDLNEIQSEYLPYSRRKIK